MLKCKHKLSNTHLLDYFYRNWVRIKISTSFFSFLYIFTVFIWPREMSDHLINTFWLDWTWVNGFHIVSQDNTAGSRSTKVSLVHMSDQFKASWCCKTINNHQTKLFIHLLLNSGFLPGDEEALEHVTDHAWKDLRKASVRRKRRMKSRRSAEERLDLARWCRCRLVLRLVCRFLKSSSVEEIHWGGGGGEQEWTGEVQKST